MFFGYRTLGFPCGLLVLTLLGIVSPPVLAGTAEPQSLRNRAPTGPEVSAALGQGAFPLNVDLELVLAVDVSGSMSPEELRAQRQGYVSALRDPDLFAAIATGPLGRVALTYVEWAGPGYHEVRAPWTVISSTADALRFAEALATFPSERRVHGATRTSISATMLFAAELLSENAITGARRVIDISGDGPNNSGVRVGVARERLLEQGITINGLPIVLRQGAMPIERYYVECVVGGPGAFTITVNGIASFETAIRTKLVLEIADRKQPASKSSLTSRGMDRLPSLTRVAATPRSQLCDRWQSRNARFD